MAASKLVMAIGASAMILAAYTWALYSEVPTAHDTLSHADGERYNGLIPSDQGALAPCAVCHRISADGPESSAPSLWGIVGAAKARSPWFGYSPALRALKGSWTAGEIDNYLTDPVGYLPGTSKTLSQVRDADERKRIIDALQRMSAP